MGGGSLPGSFLVPVTGELFLSAGRPLYESHKWELTGDL